MQPPLYIGYIILDLVEGAQTQTEVHSHIQQVFIQCLPHARHNANHEEHKRVQQKRIRFHGTCRLVHEKTTKLKGVD